MSMIQQGLLITVIGMGLVFAVIIFLWGLMALMMRFTSREKQDITEEGVLGDTDEATQPAIQASEGRRRAAAAVVAVALAIKKSKSVSLHLQRQKSPGELSPWQTHHRIRQIENRNTRG